MRGLIGLQRLDVSEGGTIETVKPIGDLPLHERLYLSWLDQDRGR